jgi:hypothetical protein
LFIHFFGGAGARSAAVAVGSAILGLADDPDGCEICRRRSLGLGDAGLTVRMTRGRKMRTVDGLFDEMAAALQFPCYFGANWDAFSE